jgi:type I restriction enzyme R subunit
MLEAAMGAVIEDVEAARSLLFPGPGDVYAAAQRVKRAGFTELRSAFLHFGGPQTAQFLQLDIVVDAVGVCEQDKTDSHTLNRKPSATVEELLNYIAQGGTDPAALTTLAGRLARMQRAFSSAQLVELKN